MSFSRERLARKSDVAEAEAELEVPVVISPSNLRPLAYTQTYATAVRTVPNATVAALAAVTAAALTVADGAGTNDGTIPAITNNASTITAVQELADQINKLVADNGFQATAITALTADVLELKKVITALIDDHQALGLCAPSV